MRHSRTVDNRANLCASRKRSRSEHTATGDKTDKLGTPWSEKIRLGKSEISDEHVCGCSDGVTRHRSVRSQPLAARWRPDLLGEPRVAPRELKLGSRRSALGLPHTSCAIRPMETASLAGEQSTSTGGAGRQEMHAKQG